jgi:hypothetical protein
MAAQHNFRFKAQLQAMNCTASAYAILSAGLVSKKLSQQQISQLITGTREFESDEEAQEHFRVLDSMAHLQEIVLPKVPIAWSADVKDVVKSTFEARRNEEDPINVQCFYVRLSVMNFFKLINSAGVQATINPEKDGAAFATVRLAEDCVRELKKMGVPARFERLTGPRRKSSLVTSLEELGFKQDLITA